MCEEHPLLLSMVTTQYIPLSPPESRLCDRKFRTSERGSQSWIGANSTRAGLVRY